MLQENELHSWLEEALIAIERFQEASNLFLNRKKIGKFSKFAMFLFHADNYFNCVPQSGLYETLCSRMVWQKTIS